MRTLLLVLAISLVAGAARAEQAILVDQAAITVVEGAPSLPANTIHVSLAEVPAANQIVFESQAPSGKLACNPNPLVFHAGQTGPLNLICIGRPDADTNDETVILTLSTAGAAPVQITITVTDDDHP